MANPVPVDPFSDSFEEAFRRIFGSTPAAAPRGVETGVEEDEKVPTVGGTIPGTEAAPPRRSTNE